MLLSRLKDKYVGAIWFGCFALIPACPWAISRFHSISEWRLEMAVFVVYLEGVLPVVMAAFFGMKRTKVICSQIESLSKAKAFGIGVRTSLWSAYGWIGASFVMISLGSLFFDTSRFSGGIVILAVCGFPVYGILGGVCGMGLRSLFLRRNRSLGV